MGRRAAHASGSPTQMEISLNRVGSARRLLGCLLLAEAVVITYPVVRTWSVVCAPN